MSSTPGDGKPSGSPDRDGFRRRPKKRFLVVDDNRDAADSLAALLRLLGDEAHVAHDGVEAVESAESLRPDVILMDLGMPRLNGLEATSRIREQAWGAAVTIVALSGWCREQDRESSREAGCDGYLVKPASLEQIEALLTGGWRTSARTENMGLLRETSAGLFAE